MSVSSLSEEHVQLILDGTKIAWHQDRVDAWKRGERIAPITIDMALTRAVQLRLPLLLRDDAGKRALPHHQAGDDGFLGGQRRDGVKGISFVSDGESTISPVFVDSVIRGSELGMSMAVGTNAYVLTEHKLRQVLPHGVSTTSGSLNEPNCATTSR